MKNKQQIKGLIIGLLIGVFVSLSAFVVTASNGTVTLENVLMEGITIVIDNKEFTATDANGNVVKPMIYNGTTYLPVRAVATAFEKAVSWDAETKTVYLGNMDGKLEKPTAKLGDLENIASGTTNQWGFTEKLNVFDNYNHYYAQAFSRTNGVWEASYLEYILAKKYNTFKATLFVPQGTNSEDITYITVIGDDQVLYTSPEMHKASEPISIEVDVSGVNDFKILYSEDGYPYIANAGFYQ